eukprot:4724386-Amphidinium_carterae.1
MTANMDISPTPFPKLAELLHQDPTWGMNGRLGRPSPRSFSSQETVRSTCCHVECWARFVGSSWIVAAALGTRADPSRLLGHAWILLWR